MEPMTRKFSPAVRQGRAANAGHASAAITLDIYADLFDDDLDYVAEALSRARHTQITIILPESPYAGPAGHRPPSNGGEITR